MTAMKNILFGILSLSLFGLASCGTKESPETAASVMLDKSKSLLQDGNYDAARDTILSMRKKHPAAVDTRARGILLLDSIEMLAARDSMGSATGDEWKRLQMKATFYERKLQEDHNKLAR